MKYNNISKKVLTIALAALPLVSCTEDVMDEINQNKNNPESVTAKFVMTDLMVGTAVNIVGGDFNTYSSVYMELEAGVENQTYNAETRKGEPSVPATYDNMWGAAYSNIRSAKDIIKKCSEGGSEEGNNITLGAAKVLYAYNAAVLTDLFGDIPYSQACLYTEDGLPQYLQPVLDKQQDIYADIMKNIDEAIVLFDSEDISAMGTQDVIYRGNAALWKKAAYAMKARYTMRMLAKSENKTQALNDVLSYIDKSFASASEEFKFAMYDGNSQYNPLFDFMYSRHGLGASQSLIDKMSERKDPRLTQSFATNWNTTTGNPTEVVTDASKFNAVPNGNPVQSTMTYDCSLASFAISAPTIFLSYHELMFLKAEALCRLGQKDKAEVALKDAVLAAFKNHLNTENSALVNYLEILQEGIKWENDREVVAEKYFNESVKPLFDANPLKEIMVQKYLSFFGANGEAVEAYSDYRRMKGMNENFIELKNPENKSKFPLRFTYGASDVLSNQNVKEACGDGMYVYTENVWWAGGSR